LTRASMRRERGRGARQKQALAASAFNPFVE
jgi:hypothetical protein